MHGIARRPGDPAKVGPVRSSSDAEFGSMLLAPHHFPSGRAVPVNAGLAGMPPTAGKFRI
jgi:hypothetical protein